MNGWTKIIAACGASAVVMVVLDLIWLGLIAKPLYQQGIGHLMAEQPRLGAAAAFYLLYAVGLGVFAVQPHAAQPGVTAALMSGALFGLFAYATYDLSNLATLRQWPWVLSLIDIGWGALLSALSAAAGKAVLDRFPAG